MSVSACVSVGSGGGRVGGTPRALALTMVLGRCPRAMDTHRSRSSFRTRRDPRKRWDSRPANCIGSTAARDARMASARMPSLETPRAPLQLHRPARHRQ